MIFDYYFIMKTGVTIDGSIYPGSPDQYKIILDGQNNTHRQFIVADTYTYNAIFGTGIHLTL